MLRIPTPSLLFVTLMALSVLPSMRAQAQTHFTGCLDGTGNVFNATVVVPVGSTPSINGTPLSDGSEIAVFSDDPAYPDLCAGVLVWQNQHAFLTVWGDDDLTPERDGLLEGETLRYRVWDSASGTEYAGSAVEILYAQGNGTYGMDELLVLGDLNVWVAPSAPALASPSDGASNVPTDVTLAWNAAPGADTYHLQVALLNDANFDAPLVDAATLTGLSYGLTGLMHGTAYHWRLRAANAGGTSPWSSPFSFTTVLPGPQPPAAPVATAPLDGAVRVATHPVLMWDEMVEAESYRVQLALGTDTLFTAPLVDSTLTAFSAEIVADVLVNLADYRWRVQASNTAGAGPWSGAHVFTTAPFDVTLKKVFLTQNGTKKAKLAWADSLVAANKVDVYVDSVFSKRTTNDGNFKQKILTPGDGPYAIYLCEKKSTEVCSNTVLADFTGATVDLMEEADGEEDKHDYAASERLGEERRMTTEALAAEVPEEVTLYANYPNPFHTATTIAFGLPRTADVTLRVYDLLGREVTTLLAETMAAGRHTVQWQARDLPSGVYLCRMEADGVVTTRTLTLVK
ncbi:MAG: T9SS type A sorting domain-containing protein [Rhodothermales bacterium]|nr:T9SS type A sorting domain-containing protein [Rhodothermales bacterium]